MKILLGLTGSVAATLGPKLITALSKDNDLKVIATKSALKFGPISGTPCEFISEEDEWSWKKLGDPVTHIQLRDWYDVFVIAPLSANTLGKMAAGICDNLLTTVWMASLNKEVIIAPAMNTQMWNHPIVQRNIKTLEDLNVFLMLPTEKTLACGENGIGAMASIEDIVKATKYVHDLAIHRKDAIS